MRRWRGGRLLADDLHRLGPITANTEWIVAACDAGFARVGMQTGPGFALSLVLRGAPRVTSALYRVTPDSAVRFIKAFEQAREDAYADTFSSACRHLMTATDRRLGGCRRVHLLWPVPVAPRTLDRCTGSLRLTRPAPCAPSGRGGLSLER